jgi:hypothetical protein
MSGAGQGASTEAYVVGDEGLKEAFDARQRDRLAALLQLPEYLLFLVRYPFHDLGIACQTEDL